MVEMLGVGAERADFDSEGVEHLDEIDRKASVQ